MKNVKKSLEENNAVLIPHGTLIAQMNSEEIESIKTPMFGNKWILRWESDREHERKAHERSKPPNAKTSDRPKRY